MYIYSYSLLVDIEIIEDLTLTLELILQVLLTKEIVKVDCLCHAYVFLDVNTDWSGNLGVWLVFMPRVEIGGSFWVVNRC